MANNQVRQVWIEINGPRSFWGERVLLFTRVNQTWQELFRQEFGMVIGVNWRLCTASYRRSNPVNGRGHCARQNDMVSELVNSFTYRRGLYKVILFNVRETRGRRALAVRRIGNRQVGNQDQVNIRNVARARLNNFSENFLRLAQAEIERLRNNNLWQQNVRRAPLSSLILQALLRRS